MRNDKTFDRRRRAPLPTRIRERPNLRNGDGWRQAACILAERHWLWDGKKWHEPQECVHCDRVVYKVDENLLCVSCAERYAKENGY